MGPQVIIFVSTEHESYTDILKHQPLEFIARSEIRKLGLSQPTVHIASSSSFAPFRFPSSGFGRWSEWEGSD
jgi:hypothetical protein